MKKINLIIAIVALVAIIVGWLLGSDERQSEFSAQPVFSDLQRQIEAVDAFKLESASGIILAAKKQDGNWLAENSGDYPLQKDQVVRLLNNVVQAELNSAKTAKPENFARLGLQDIAQNDSEAKLLTLFAAEQQWSLLVGNTASSGNGIYVRKPGENQTWLSNTPLSLPTEPNAWLETKILDINLADISEISRTDHWRIVREAVDSEGGTSGEAKWQLAELEEGRALQYDSILENTAENIISLSFDALAHPRPYEIQEDNLQSQVTIKTNSSDIITMKLYRVDEKDLLVLDSETLDSRWQQWVYELSAFNAGRLSQNIEDFLQPLPEASVDTEPEGD
ncbi:DUF4340 domain-containing protein [Planctobacterium marinum]|uniref:DUF4340 domain-containing protein n=1 Tax=Planctobacterium marinum TaxID=1631968 RepID=A0AA48I7T8_9ALTE|nr:hypothetical protein MACH26_30810 [Planctobacterium marinum]